MGDAQNEGFSHVEITFEKGIDYAGKENIIIQKDLPRSTRHLFIRKIMIVFFIQTLFISSMGLFFLLHDDAGEWIRRSTVIQIAAISTLIILLVLGFFPKIGRFFPLNCIVLGFLTICITIFIGSLSSRFSTYAFFLPVICLTVLALIFILFTLQKGYDFQGVLPYLLVIVVLLIVYLAVAAIENGFIIESRSGEVLYSYGDPDHNTEWIISLVLAIFFCFFTVYRLKNISSGKHKRITFTTNDYILGTSSILFDVLLAILAIIVLFILLVIFLFATFLSCCLGRDEIIYKDGRYFRVVRYI